MSAIPAQDLLDESKCYLCYGVSQSEALKLALLNRIASGSSSLGYSVYTALLSEDGGLANAPQATVLRNTIGPIVWSRTGVGIYLATLNGAFDINKTFLVMAGSSYEDTDGIVVAGVDSINAVRMVTLVGGALQDGVLNFYSFEIRVYP